MAKNILRLTLAILTLALVFSACGQSGPTEKDIIGKWQSTTLPDLWVEFRPDKTSTGGRWELTKEGVKVINPDGTEHLGVLKEGKLVFAEFGQHGVFVKETSPQN